MLAETAFCSLEFALSFHASACPEAGQLLFVYSFSCGREPISAEPPAVAVFPPSSARSRLRFGCILRFAEYLPNETYALCVCVFFRGPGDPTVLLILLFHFKTTKQVSSKKTPIQALVEANCGLLPGTFLTVCQFQPHTQGIKGVKSPRQTWFNLCTHPSWPPQISNKS